MAATAVIEGGRTGPGRRSLWRLGLVAVLALPGCAAEPLIQTRAAESPAEDLLAALPHAEVLASGERRPPQRIELGSAESRSILGDGWSEPVAGDTDTGRDGDGWRWAPAPMARLRLLQRAPADRRLLLTARRPEEVAAQRVEIWLNGRQLAAQELAGDWSTVAAQAPREEWLPGVNDLLLRFAALRVAEGASRSAQVARLVIETVGEPALVAERDADGRRVFQPAGRAVDLFRRLPERAPRLRLAASRRDGEGDPLLAVEIEPDGGELTELWRGELAGDETRSLDLSPWAGRLVRLRLRALSSGLSWRRLELAGGAVAAAAPAASPVVSPAALAAAGRPNIVLYVIDTLRADHTSLYGYHRPTTPRLEALAADSVVFDPAWANTSWTKPGTATLLTGALPSVHGATNTASRLSPGVELLSETLGRAGYATHAVVTNPILRRGWGLDRGWDDYRHIDLDQREFTGSSARINHAVIPRLGELAAAGRPFFLYLHSMDPHAPYLPPEAYRRFVDPAYAGPVDGSTGSARELLDRLRSDGAVAHAADLEHLAGLYDGAIEHNDARVGELLDAFDAAGLLETTAVLVTSDHGEEFFEHGGVMHGHSLYQEQIRIPMLLRPPGGTAPRRVAGAQQIDVVATLAALAGVAPPPRSRGRDLLAGAMSEPLGDRAVFAEEELRDQRLWSLVEGGMKLHYDRNERHAASHGRETLEVFDLAADAAERVNLARARPVLAGYLRERARALAAELVEGAEPTALEPGEPDDEMRRRLAALGYLQ